MSWVGLLHSPRMTREQPPETSPRHAVEARPLHCGCHLRAGRPGLAPRAFPELRLFLSLAFI